MATNIEIEAKVLITEKEYNNVVSHFLNRKISEFDQINHYIETEDFQLKKIGVGLRIREKDECYTLTLKAPMAEGLLEKNEELTRLQFNSFMKRNLFPECQIKEFIKMLGVKIEDLKILTQLTTHRIDISMDDRVYVFSIDKNVYNDLVDYELEVEGPSLNKAKDMLKSICNQTNTFYKDNLKSKETRALETIKKE